MTSTCIAPNRGVYLEKKLPVTVQDVCCNELNVLSTSIFDLGRKEERVSPCTRPGSEDMARTTHSRCATSWSMLTERGEACAAGRQGVAAGRARRGPLTWPQPVTLFYSRYLEREVAEARHSEASAAEGTFKLAQLVKNRKPLQLYYNTVALNKVYNVFD